jgi:hypothetical protein
MRLPRVHRLYERCGWTRMGVMPSYSVRPDGSLAANAFD